MDDPFAKLIVPGHIDLIAVQDQVAISLPVWERLFKGQFDTSVQALC